MQHLREMQVEDIKLVVRIIDDHDDDDANDAKKDYKEAGGLDNQYVLEVDGTIIGVTGYRTPEGCENTHWLSWTYVHEDHVNQGHGRRMLKDLITHLKDNGGRKLFIKISDYAEPDDKGTPTPVYAAAMHVYESLGAQVELTLRDYYDEGESLYILGLRLNEGEDDSQFEIAPEDCPVNFESAFEIADTDDAWSFGWNDTGKKVFKKADLKLGTDHVREKEGRVIFLSFPHNYTKVSSTLISGGYEKAGTLQDYYDDGVHEDHFALYLN